MGRPAKNLIGKKFGKLTVLERAENATDGHAQWKCQCDCGNIVIVNSSSLQRKGSKATKSCGCNRIQKAKIKGNINRIKDRTNQRFGKLVALQCIGGNGHSALWRCKCDCGNENFITTAAHLVTGNTKSCGCSTSIGEDIIASILQSNNIIFEKQKTFKDCILNTGGFGRYDFFLPNQNRLIEYDGEIHFSFNNSGWNTEQNFTRIQESDNIKNKWAAAHNIPLVRIPYWERDNITLDMLLGDQYLVKGDA